MQPENPPHAPHQPQGQTRTQRGHGCRLPPLPTTEQMARRGEDAGAPGPPCSRRQGRNTGHWSRTPESVRCRLSSESLTRGQTGRRGRLALALGHPSPPNAQGQPQLCSLSCGPCYSPTPGPRRCRQEPALPARTGQGRTVDPGCQTLGQAAMPGAQRPASKSSESGGSATSSGSAHSQDGPGSAANSFTGCRARGEELAEAGRGCQPVAQPSHWS